MKPETKKDPDVSGSPAKPHSEQTGTDEKKSHALNAEGSDSPENAEENEGGIVADPEGARLHGNTKAA